MALAIKVTRLGVMGSPFREMQLLSEPLYFVLPKLPHVGGRVTLQEQQLCLPPARRWGGTNTLDTKGFIFAVLL